MKLFFTIATFALSALTIVMAVLVITSKGEMNAGYSVIPAVFAIASLAGLRAKTKK